MPHIGNLRSLYQTAPWRVRLYVALRSALLETTYLDEKLPQKGRVIDLGCGFGVLANRIALEHPDLQVRGYDFDAYRIATAQSTVGTRSNIQFVLGDALKSEFTADVVIMTDFLHHLAKADQHRLLRDLHTNLPSGGRLIVLDVVGKRSFRTMMSWLADWVLYPRMTKNQFHSLSDWIEVFSRAGFHATVFDRRTSVFAGIGFLCTKAEDYAGAV